MTGIQEYLHCPGKDGRIRRIFHRYVLFSSHNKRNNLHGAFVHAFSSNVLTILEHEDVEEMNALRGAAPAQVRLYRAQHERVTGVGLIMHVSQTE